MAVKSPSKARAAKSRSVRPGDPDYYRGDDYPIGDSVGYLIKQVRAAQERLVDAEMAEHDLTGVQWGPLLIIYYGILKDLAEVDIWRTTYYHALDGGADAIVEWFKGSGFRPFLAPLDEDERVAFLDRYCREIAEAYTVFPDDKVLLPFPRLFIVARRAL